MNEQQIIKWLLEGDVSIQYQVYRDLLEQDKKDHQKRIALEGWGKLFLSKRNSNGHWGQKFYFPKWTSSHYTLLDLKNLGIGSDNDMIKETLNIILSEEMKHTEESRKKHGIVSTDMCINGMFLNYASYFKTSENRLETIVDYILTGVMQDGGFNCMFNRQGAVHSSLHSTLSVLEGITEYEQNGYNYRLDELLNVASKAREFILLHQLYISDRTGEVINQDFLKLSYPSRWKYDILRALDYFCNAGISWDDRMSPAIKELLKKRNKDGSWNLNAKHPGQVYFEMEKSGKPSRWNTLRALRVLKHFNKLP